MPMIASRSLLLILIVYLGTLIQCGNDTPPEYRRLFRLPTDQQQLAELKKYSLEQQIDTYIYAMQREPPSTQFARFLASNGKKVIPLLLKRLKEERSEHVKVDFIRVLADMHTDYCSLKDEKEVIETIRGVISGMRDTSYKEWGEAELKVILEQPGSSNPC
jgi:hypothetical protein